MTRSKYGAIKRKKGVCNVDIREMKAGRELDALVAERVMGLNIKLKGCVEGEAIDQCLFDWDPDVPCPCSYMEKHKTNIGCEHYQPVFKRYSTDISAAWEVVNRLYPIMIYHYSTIGDETGYRVTIEGVVVTAETAPEAICKAALAVMEGI